MNEGFLVTESIQGAHFSLKDYPLLEGDLLVISEDKTFFKEGPGLGIGGFTLTPDQVKTLKPVKFTSYGLNYKIHE